MFKLCKKSNGGEVIFTTKEGMMGTLKAFPEKYKLPEDAEIIEEPVQDEESFEEIPDIVDDSEIPEVNLDEEPVQDEE